MRRLALLGFVAIACGAAPVQAQTLSLGYHSGDTYRYSFHSTSRQALVAAGVTIPIDIEMTAAETVKVKSVDSSGVADLALTVSGFTLKSTSSGVTNATTGTPAFSTAIKVAGDGRIVSVDGSQVAAGNPFLAFSDVGGGFFVTAVLPITAVKPGDTWSKDYSQANPSGSGAIQVKSQSKYVRNEQVGGINAAVIETTSTASIDINLGAPPAGAATATFAGISMKGTTTSDVTTWLDPSGHRVLKTRSTQSNEGTLDLGSSTGLSGMTGPMTIKGTGTTDLTPA
ncbi:MAG: hypothetical protein ACYDAL_16410 [Candidatus Dormibacteraceae bacterium]